MKSKLFEVGDEWYSWLERSKLIVLGANLQVGANFKSWLLDVGVRYSGLIKVGARLKENESTSLLWN